MICMRETFFSQFEENNDFLSLSLLGCDWCSKIKENNFDIEDSHKYSLLFIEPIFQTVNTSEHVLLRACGINRLEEIQNLFKKDENCDKNILKFFSCLQLYHEDNEMIVKAFRGLSEFTFLEIIKRVIFNEDYKLAQMIIINFYLFNVEDTHQGFRNKLYFRLNEDDKKKQITFYEDDTGNIVSGTFQYSSKEPFFHIGYSLDEGCTQYITNKILKHSGMEQENSIYYFEVRFINEMIKLYGEKKIFEKYSIGRGIDFIFEITQNAKNKCDFYKLYKLTDEQDWKSAIGILKSILKEN